MKRCPFDAGDSMGPITSMPYAANGQGEAITVSSFGGTCIKSQCTWHWIHFCTYRMLPLSMVIQKNLALKIFFANVNPFMWGLHVFACISSKSLVSFVASTHRNNPKFEVLVYGISPLRKKWFSILLRTMFSYLWPLQDILVLLSAFWCHSTMISHQISHLYKNSMHVDHVSVHR